MRWTTGQPHLLAVVPARRFSLFGHIPQMPDETDAKKSLIASPLENWRRPPGHPCTMWMKTIQQDLKSNNLSLNEVIDVAQNHPLWSLISIWCCTLLVVHTRKEEKIIHTTFSSNKINVALKCTHIYMLVFNRISEHHRCCHTCRSEKWLLRSF